jgi:peptide deformylase
LAILKIARMGHPVLLGRAEPITDPGAPEIRRLVADMIETMEDAGGAGLAAPQVHVPLRLFVFRVPQLRVTGDRPEGAIKNTVLINPVIELLGDDIRQDWEGCLSIPGLRARVPRHWRVRYHAVDLEGAPILRDASGFHAKVVQHEADHLDGILYPMRITEFASFGFNEDLSRAEAEQAARQPQGSPGDS